MPNLQKNKIIKKRYINVKGRLLSLDTPLVMGIINATPDSFYGKSRVDHTNEATQKASEMLEQGATIIDIGGYSSRPGAFDPPLEDEIKRVVPIVESIKQRHPEAVISIDTFRSFVAIEAVKAGAEIVNDISGGELDEQMFETVGGLGVPYILMHMKGTPQTMQSLASYKDMIPEIITYFRERLSKLVSCGCKDVILDPGFGFAKNIEHNNRLLNNITTLDIFELPVLVGLSRKSMIYRSLNISAEEALNGTTVLNTIALLKGASILRVHDVKEAVEAVRLVEKFKKINAS